MKYYQFFDHNTTFNFYLNLKSKDACVHAVSTAERLEALKGDLGFVVTYRELIQRNKVHIENTKGPTNFYSLFDYLNTITNKLGLVKRKDVLFTIMTDSPSPKVLDGGYFSIEFPSKNHQVHYLSDMARSLSDLVLNEEE